MLQQTKLCLLKIAEHEAKAIFHLLDLSCLLKCESLAKNEIASRKTKELHYANEKIEHLRYICHFMQQLIKHIYGLRIKGKWRHRFQTCMKNTYNVNLERTKYLNLSLANFIFQI